MKRFNKKILCQIALVLCSVMVVSSCLMKKNYNMKPVSNAVDIAANAAAELKPGDYKLDKSHASLIFRVNHLGLSRYNLRFKRFDVNLKFDPQDPEKSSVTATIDPTSIETDYPEPKKLDFNAKIAGKDWLNAKKFTNITFRSEKIEMTGPTTARVHGHITLHGVTKPIILYTMFNGGYASSLFEPNSARIGFSSRGFINRSEFGISTGIPPKDSTMGVGDTVEFAIEVEFTKDN